MLPENYAFSGTILLWPSSRATSPACEGDTIVEAGGLDRGRHPLIAHLRYKGGWTSLSLADCPPQLCRITRDPNGKLLITRNLYRLAAILAAYRGKSPIAIMEQRLVVAFKLPTAAVTGQFEPLPNFLAQLDAEGHA